MAFKKKAKFEGARSAKGLRSSAASRAGKTRGPEREPTSWDEAKRERDEAAMRDAALSDESRLWPVTERMKEALLDSIQSLSQKGERARGQVESVASSGLGPEEEEARMSPALEAARLAEEELLDLAREAAAEGLLDLAREALAREGAAGAGWRAKLARALAAGCLERLGAGDVREWGEPESQAREPAAADMEAVRRWVADGAFWQALAEPEEAPARAPTLTERRWSHVDERRETIRWGAALMGLAGLIAKRPAAREAGAALWDRLADAMDAVELSASWDDLGQEAGLLGRAGLDEAGVKSAMELTPGAYWLGVRAALTGRSSGGAGGGGEGSLEGMILTAAIERAAREEDAKALLGEHLWGSLDTEGLWAWRRADAKAPLEAIEKLDLPWESSTFMLSLSNRSDQIAWAAPALRAAGLEPREGRHSSAWFEGGAQARAKAAFEGIYALMESRELKSSVLPPAQAAQAARARPGL